MDAEVKNNQVKNRVLKSKYLDRINVEPAQVYFIHNNSRVAKNYRNSLLMTIAHSIPW